MICLNVKILDQVEDDELLDALFPLNDIGSNNFLPLASRLFRYIHKDMENYGFLSSFVFRLSSLYPIFYPSNFLKDAKNGKSCKRNKEEGRSRL